MKTLITFFLALNVFIAHSTDFYWVGGSGNWSDYANHWTTTSGGTVFHTTVPGTLDNVYIDDNSFREDGTIMLDELGYCNDFDASGLTNFNVDLTPVTYNGTGADYLYIHGSMTGSSNYNSGLFYTYFLSTGMENITSNGGRLGVYLRFEEANGTWQIRDDVAGITGIALNLGSLVIAGVDTTTIRFFDVANSSNFKSLTLSDVYLDTDFFRIGNNNLTYSITNTTIAVEDQFEVYANPMTVDDVIFLSQDPLNVEGDWTMNNLLIEPGADVTIQSGTTLTTNQMQLGGGVETFLRSSTPGTEATLRQASGEVSGDFLNLTDIHGTGGATFTASASTDNGNNTGWVFIKDYYWVGGSGNWSNYANHWASTSGGTAFHTTVPGTLDNVYIDDNSFVADGTIMLDELGYCNDFDASGLTNFNVDLTPVTYNGTGADYLYIHGSMTGSSNYNSGLFYTYFLSTGVEDITSNGGRLGVYLRFEEADGTWNIKDDVTGITGIALNLGSLVIAEVDTTTIRFFDVANSANFKSLTLSNLYLDTDFFRIGNNNLTYNISNTTIAVEDQFEVYANPMTVDDVIFLNQDALNVEGNWTIDRLTIESGADVTFQSGITQTINELTLGGTTETFLRSSTAGAEAILSQSSGEVTGEFLNLTDIHATGGATFTATASIDNGNNTGWVFIKDYYWVGGSGNWSNYANHWASTSGGTVFHTTVPGTLDNVYIDDNSFVADGTIMLDELGYCNDFDASGLTNFNVDLTPVTYNGTGADYLYIHGSMTGSSNYNSGLFYTYFLSTGVEDITSNGGRLGVYLRFEEAAGTWNIKDDVAGINGIALNLGSLVIEEVDTTTIRFFDVANSANFKSLTMSNLYLDTDFFRIGNNNLTYNISNTTIAVEDQFEVYANPMTVDDVIFLNQDALNVEGNWTIDRLTIESGADVTFQSGITQTINELTFGGTTETFLRSSTAGAEAILSQSSGEVTGEFLNLTDIHVTGGATFTATASIDNGNNTGWVFIKDYYWVGGSGNWSDLSHWATTSGGTFFHTAIPSALDNVLFDANSFNTANETVEIDGTFDCRDLTVDTDEVFTLRAAYLNNFSIYGSLFVNELANLALYNFWLKSDNAVTITVKTTTSSGNTMQLEGNGTYTFMHDFNLSYSIYCQSQSGTVDFNDFNITASQVYYTAGNLNLGSSIIDVRFFRHTNHTNFDAGTSTILVSEEFSGGALTFNDVTLTNNNGSTGVNFLGSNSFNNLTIEPGTVVNIEPSQTQTITNLVAQGTAGEPITIQSSTPGIQTTLSQASGLVDASNLILQDIAATGGATFTASASTDNGNNTGWTFELGDQVISFTLDPYDTVVVLQEPFELVGIASSGLDVYFTSSDESVASITGDRQLSVHAPGFTVITAKQDGNAQWNPAPDVEQVLMVTKADQQIDFAPLPDVTFGDPPFEVLAISSSGLPITYSSNDETIITITDNIVTIVGAGSADITASQTGDSTYNAAEDVIQTLRVNKADQAISFSAIPNFNLGVDDPIVLDATASSGLSVQYLVEGLATLDSIILTPTGPGTVSVTASQFGNANYNPAPEITRTFDVLEATKEDQTITFDLIPEKTYEDAPFELIATSSSGLPITFQSSNELVITVDGSTSTVVGAGVTTISALQAGDDNFNASSASQEVIVNKADQTITFSALPDITFGDPPVQLDATASSGLEVQYEVSGPVTLEGNILTPTGTGVVAVTALQGGNTNYNPAPEVGWTFNIFNLKEDQTITFDLISEKTYGDEPFDLIATSSSGLPVTFQSSDELVISINGSIAMIEGAGAATLTATQEGNENYNAVSTSQEIIVNRADQTITFSALPNITFGDPPVQLDATASSGLEIQYEVFGPVTLEGNILTPTGTGIVEITASQSGDSNYNPAPDVGWTFNILDAAKEDQTITFDLISEKTFGDDPFELIASASSGLGIIFQSSDELIMSISGNLATINGAGIVTLTALQEGNENFNQASTAQEVTVNKADQTITFDPITDVTLGDPPITLNATTSSGLVIEYLVTGPATLEGNILTPTAPGNVTVRATQIGDSNYNPAMDVVRQFEVLDPSKLDQVITFDPFPSKRFGDANFSLSGSSSSNLGLTYESSNLQVASLTGNIVLINGVGQTEITASQLGDDTYNPAVPVTQLLTVDKGLVTISIINVWHEYDGLPKSVTVTTIPSGLDYEITYNNSIQAPSEAGFYDVQVTIISDLYEGSANAVMEIYREPEEVTISITGISYTYDGNPKEATVAVTPTAAYEVTYDGNSSAPVDAGNYQVHVEIIEEGYFGSADATLMIEKAAASIIFAENSLTQVYDGTPKPVLFTTDPEGLNAEFMYDGSAEIPINSGVYNVEGNIVESNYTGSGLTTLSITKAQANIQFNSNTLEQEFDGDPKSVSVTTDPEGLNVIITYNESTDPPINANEVPGYEVIASIEELNYEGQVVGTLIVHPGLLLRTTVPKTLRVYPNPVNTMLHMSLENSTGIDWVISDMSGKQLLSGSSQKDLVVIDVSRLKSGIYYLIIDHMDQVRIRIN